MQKLSHFITPFVVISIASFFLASVSASTMYAEDAGPKPTETPNSGSSNSGPSSGSLQTMPPTTQQPTTQMTTPPPTTAGGTSASLSSPQATTTTSNSGSGSSSSGSGSGTTSTSAPGISSPSYNATVKGVRKIEVQAQAGSKVDVQLQPVSSHMGSVYIGRISVAQDKTSGSLSWDTRNTPNGTYNLFATVTLDGGSSVIVGPVRVTVANEHEEHAEQEQHRQEGPGASSTTSKKPGGATATAVPSPSATTARENQQTIVFPQEFDPKVVPSDAATKVTTVENTKSADNTVGITFTGKAQPNTIITLLIFSNPIVVTVKTDANGVWKYTLEKPLAGGKHEVYAVVPKADGTKVRSEVASFFISEALAADSGGESLTLASAPTNGPIVTLVVGTTVLIVLGVVGLLIIYIKKRKHLSAVHHEPVQ